MMSGIKKTSLARFAAASALALAVSHGQAMAQEAAQPPADEGTSTVGVEDIIVTAERREASLQRTPIAMSAITGDTLQKQQAVNIESVVDSLPMVSFSRQKSDARIFIRGIGVESVSEGSDPRVALYTDGIYHARVQGLFGALYDVERIEVLAGPQGTLYGRNATAGAINIITRNPTDVLDGYASVAIGNYAQVRTEGAISGPLSDTISARIAFQTADRSGFGTNISTGAEVDNQHTRSVRGKLKFEPSDNFNLILQGDYFWEDDNAGGYHWLANQPGKIATGIQRGFVAPGVRDAAGTGPSLDIETIGLGATATWDLGGATLTSITGYRRMEFFALSNVDATTSNYLPRLTHERSNQYTQELRLAAALGPIDLIVGAYYFKEKNYAGRAASLSGVYFNLPDERQRRGSVGAANQETTAYALFTQATVNLSDAFKIDLGLRYSDESRNISQFNQSDLVTIFDPTRLINERETIIFPTTGAVFNNLKAKWTSWDPKITLRYQFNPRVMAYATYSTGFKSGGFNLAFNQQAFAPETIEDFEGGIKADLFDGKVRANLSAFHYDYTNLQVNIIDSVGTSSITRNAGGAEIYGAEGQITLIPADGLRLGLNLAWLNAKFTDYKTVDPIRPELGLLDLAGNRLTNAPEFKFVGDIAYDIEAGFGTLTPRATVTWVDRIYFDQFMLPYQSQAPRTNIDIGLDYESPDEEWIATLYVRNLTDKLYMSNSVVASGFIGSILGLPGAPRTYGVSVTRKF